jgi:peptide/nickel transport system permease protein
MMRPNLKTSVLRTLNPSGATAREDTTALLTTPPPTHGWRAALQVFLRNKIAVVGAAIILLLVLVALLAPLLAPEGYNAQDLSSNLQAPSAEHIFGTDDFGRDVFARIVYGAQVSLRVGVLAVIGSFVVGTLLGLAAGFYGGWRDTIISRLFDILLAFPSILLAIAIVAILGPSLTNALIAIATINVPIFGRLVRSKVLSLKEEDYITAARAIGASNGRLILRHLFPNSLAPLIVQGTLSVGAAVIETAALGFLGLGAQAPFPEWGRMLADSQEFIQKAPWTVLFPGIAIALTVLGFNLLGDGLRDALDPRSRK